MTIRAMNLTDTAQALANLARGLSPGVDLALAGADALLALFEQKQKLDQMFKLVLEETRITAPDVAQQVSAFYISQGMALESEFQARPGE